jgi:DnaJ-domain-containing protein 1
MSAKKITDIKRQMVVHLFWGLVVLGLIVSKSVHGFWLFLCWFWFISHVISIYKSIGQYGREARDSQYRFERSQAEFRKSRERYDNIFNKRKTRDFDEVYDEYKKFFEEQYRQQQRQVVVNRGEMSIADAYKLMKLTYSNTPDEIKKKYRQLAMQWHPDRFATESKSKQEIANRNFQKLNSAYSVIKKHKNIA